MENLFFKVVEYISATNQIIVEMSKSGDFSSPDYSCSYDLKNLKMLNYQHYIKEVFESLITHYDTTQLFLINNLNEFKLSDLDVYEEINKIIKIEYIPEKITPPATDTTLNQINL